MQKQEAMAEALTMMEAGDGLGEAERWLRVLAGLGDGLWDWDLVTDRVWFSPGFGALLGWSDAAAFEAAFSFRSHLHAEDAGEVLPQIHQVLDGRLPRFDAVYRLRDRAGAYRWFHGRGVVLRDAAGRPRRFAGVLTDVNARMAAQQARQQREAAQRQRLRQEVLAQFSQALAPGLAALEAQQPQLQWRMLPQLLASLGPRQAQQLVAVDAVQRLPLWLAAAGQACGASGGCDLRCSVEEALAGGARVLVDEGRVELVLRVLLDNACRAVRGCGSAVRVRLCSDEGGQGVVLRVQDDGAGMAPEVLARVFEPFFTTQPPGEGWGLGLAVAQRLVSGFGGRLQLRSVPGEGTEALLWLPRVGGEVRWEWSVAGGEGSVARARTRAGQAEGDRGRAWAVAESAAGAVPSEPGGRHVVYVDDYEAMVFLVSRMLQRRGHRVTAFERAAEALEFVRAHGQEVDLLVSDFNMPGMSGLDLVRQVMALWPGLPTALTSGYITPAMALEAQAHGVRLVLNRQDSVEEQVEALVRLLDALPRRSRPLAADG